MTNTEIQTTIKSLADQSAMLSRLCKASSNLRLLAELVIIEADRVQKETHELNAILSKSITDNDTDRKD